MWMDQHQTSEDSPSHAERRGTQGEILHHSFFSPSSQSDQSDDARRYHSERGHDNSENHHRRNYGFASILTRAMHHKNQESYKSNKNHDGHDEQHTQNKFKFAVKKVKGNIHHSDSRHYEKTAVEEHQQQYDEKKNGVEYETKIERAEENHNRHSKFHLFPKSHGAVHETVEMSNQDNDEGFNGNNRPHPLKTSLKKAPSSLISWFHGEESVINNSSDDEPAAFSGTTSNNMYTANAIDDNYDTSMTPAILQITGVPVAAGSSRRFHPPSALGTIEEKEEDHKYPKKNIVKRFSEKVIHKQPSKQSDPDILLTLSVPRGNVTVLPLSDIYDQTNEALTPTTKEALESCIQDLIDYSIDIPIPLQDALNEQLHKSQYRLTYVDYGQHILCTNRNAPRYYLRCLQQNKNPHLFIHFSEKVIQQAMMPSSSEEFTDGGGV